MAWPMKEYYHDSRTKTLSVAPTNPTVSEKTDCRRNTIITVTASIEVYCFDGKNGPKMRNLSYAAKEQYTSRDSREQAVRYFKSSNHPKGEPITAREYFDLYQKYEDELPKGTT